MEILTNYDLTKLNTFGIKAKADFFIEINNEEELQEIFKSSQFKNNEKLFLGGGSNILFTKDFNGLVILNKLKGIEIVREDENEVLVRSMGGEWWNDLVNFTIDRGYWGIENLALIPGTVGATPVQNIGAYGVELKDMLESIETYEIKTGEKKIFTNTECEFGYRDSVFKSKWKGQYFIGAVILKLSKKENKNIRYRALQEYLDENNIEVKDSKDISNAISEIRKSKLPDPKIIGNAGSFFKNVYVTQEKLQELKKTYQNIPSFVEEEDLYKIPSGWLIEQCGWKGKRIGNVGMHEKQALVLVNYGGATGQEVKNFAELVIGSVYEKFAVKLIPEVNLI